VYNRISLKKGKNMKDITNTKVYLFSVLAALLLVVSGFSYWLTSTIFNEQAFTNATNTVITSQSTTDSISAGIVDKALENNPVAKNLLGTKLQGVVSGLLSTDTFAGAVKNVSGRVYLQITSQDPKGVVIDTTTVKSLVTPILGVVASPEQKAKVEGLNIPDQVVLVDPSTVPSIYYLTSYTWIWPFALLGGLGLFGYTIYASKEELRLVNTQKAAGMLAGVGFLAAAVIPSIEPTVIKGIQNFNLRVVAGNIYEGLSAPLYNMYFWLTVVALLVLAGTFSYQMYVKWATKK
jgi:hypothetical protein